MKKRLRTAFLVAAGCALLVFPALALAKSVTLAGNVSGDTSTPGRIGLVFKLDGEGTPTKLLLGSYNGIDASCPQGGVVQALGPIGSAPVKKKNGKLTFKWSGKSGPSGTAKINGTVKPNGKKATGTFSQSYNAGSSSAPFVCTSDGVDFKIKKGG